MPDIDTIKKRDAMRQKRLDPAYKAKEKDQRVAKMATPGEKQRRATYRGKYRSSEAGISHEKKYKRSLETRQKMFIGYLKRKFCIDFNPEAVLTSSQEKRARMLNLLPDNGTRKCCKCGDRKNKEDFGLSKSASDGISPMCKGCCKADSRKWRENNREKARQNARDYEKRFPEKVAAAKRKAIIKRKYGIKYDDWMKLWHSQNGKCAICGDSFKDESSVHTDHDHVTGKVRGLLCHRENVGLGLFRDSIEILQKTIEYLKKHNTL